MRTGERPDHSAPPSWPPDPRPRVVGRPPMTEIVLRIPRADEWVSSNDRIHWRVKAERMKTWRYAGAIWARKAKLRGLGRSHVTGELVMLPKRRARIDPANYQDTAKAVIDGLVDAGVWPDDSTKWVTGPDMRLGAAADGPEFLILHIFPEGEQQ